MKSFLRATLVATLLLAPSIVAAGGPFFDPFVEKFSVGAWDDPGEAAGWPGDLLAPAVMDSAWYGAARAVLRFPEDSRAASLWEALADTGRAARWRRVALADLEDPLAAGPVTGTAGPVLAFFASLAENDTSTARRLAGALAEREDQTQAARVTWSLRTEALGPQGLPVWPAADTLLAHCGPWDGANTWSLAVELRRNRGQKPVPVDVSDEHGRLVGRLARSRLTADDLAAAPYGQDLKAALGALSLKGEQLADHLADHPAPPADPEYQGWWLRGQRTLSGGEASTYESLAARTDLLPRWRLDLWRRASERRFLAGEWIRSYEDLVAAYDLARTAGVGGGLRYRLDIWTEQALAGALAHGRREDARRMLDLAEANVSPDLQPRLAVWRTRLGEGDPAAIPTSTDRVDVARDLFRYGAAADARSVTGADREHLVRQAAAPPWDLWRSWGLALASQRGIPAARRDAAAAYREALYGASDPQQCLAAALGRLARHRNVPEELLAFALAGDARRLTNWTSPPRRSPVPDLMVRLRGSQGDLHALLGAALWLGDMRGVMAVASALEGTGLTRDEKRRFLYPLPAPGPVLDGILAAQNDPALLLAIARNESAFEPAVRSRAGALGFMQVMPFHHPERGALRGVGHWSQPGSAIARGDALVTENRRRYRGDPYRLLAAYNAGPEAAGRWDRQLGGGADRAEYAAWIGYTETRKYVEKVLIDRDVYAWILSGSGD